MEKTGPTIVSILEVINREFASICRGRVEGEGSIEQTSFH